MPKSVKGTIAYLAPEVVLAQFNKSNYDGRLSDVWSCGVMLYIMLFGSYPFQDGANQQFNRTVKVWSQREWSRVQVLRYEVEVYCSVLQHGAAHSC